MRPVTMTMQAFGSYGKKTTVDFTETNQNLFLITGDTGAGKTTIFDAIVFALYGEASSGLNKKDGVELQSQFAEISVEPFVELEFTEFVGGEEQVYAVKRIPRHVRASKRKGAKEQQEISETVELTLPDGSPYHQNIRETNAKLEEILGLTKAQFMQVGMIAQGEFMQLLRASSDDKKPVFRKLFNTDIYQDIIEELRRRFNDKKAEMARIRTECQTEIGHAVIPESSENAQILRETRSRIIGADRLNIADLESFQKELEAFCEDLRGENATLEEKKLGAKKERDARRDAFTKAGQLLKLFEQLEKAERDLQEGHAEKPQIESKKNLQTAISSAYEIRNVYQRYDDAARAVRDKEEAVKRQKKLLPVLTEAAKQAAEEERAALALQKEKQEAYAKISDKVSSAKELFEKIEKAEVLFLAKKEEWTAADAEQSRAKRDLTDFEEREKRFREQTEEFAEADILYEKWKSTKKEADAVREDITSYHAALRDIEAQHAAAAKAQEAYENSRDLFLKKNDEYSRKSMAYLDAQAGFIAKERLKEGEPCPVCGSVEHPQPCMLSEEHRELTRDVIDALAEEAASLRNEQEKKALDARAAAELLTEKKNACAEKLSALQKRIRGMLPELAGPASAMEPAENFAGPASVDAAVGAFEEWAARSAGKEKLLKENADKLAAAREALKGTDEKKSALAAAAEQAAEKAGRLKEEYARSEEALKSLEGQKQYASRQEAEQELHAAASEKEAAEEAFTKAGTKAKNAKAEQDRCMALEEQFRQEIPGLVSERGERKADYDAVLTGKDMTEAEWKEITDSHPRSEFQTLQDEIDAYRRKMATAEGSYNAARNSIGDQTKPDIEAFDRAKTEAENELEKAEAAYSENNEIFRTNTGVLRALAPKMEERTRVVQESSRIGSMYERMAGKVKNARMDIETFVQRYHLQRILYAANARFQDMSAGQFELRMKDISEAGSGKNRGLDLMVYSTVTGKEREIRTLSGGESFMAALALALGMADQIRENSASINLDVMFIDEGFGSLDDHSRNQAVKVLQQMAGGSRLIGIISHVTELKQEIDDQLIVTKDENGSHVAWQIS